MTTLVTMKTRIVDETLRDDLTTTQLNNAINDAITQWEGERFAFNEARYRILTVADQEYYTLITPTLLTSASAAVGTGEMILEIDGITCTVGSQPYPLCPRTQGWFDENQSGTHTGEPADYGIYGNQLRLFPVPNAVRTLNIYALARLSPTPMSGDTDTNAWMTEGERLVRQTAKMILYRDIIRDETGAKLAIEGMKEALENMKRKMAAKAYTGVQRPWSL